MCVHLFVVDEAIDWYAHTYISLHCRLSVYPRVPAEVTFLRITGEPSRDRHQPVFPLQGSRTHYFVPEMEGRPRPRGETCFVCPRSGVEGRRVVLRLENRDGRVICALARLPWLDLAKWWLLEPTPEI
jgi:hypothetical protein